MSLILMLFGILVIVGILNWTFELAYGDTNLQFAISECPVMSNGVDEESGQCPNMKTIENEGDHIGNEQSDTSASGDHIGNEQSDTSTAISSGPVNPFGP